MSGAAINTLLLHAIIVFAGLAVFGTMLLLFLRALADTFAPVINYCANQPAEPGPIVGYWYDPYAPMTASFFQQRTESALRHGEFVPGQEGKDWGAIRGPVADHEHATPDALNCCVTTERAS
jgi:hypothetical protein